MRYSSTISLLVIGLTLFGAGCSKSAPSTAVTNTPGSPGAQAKFPTFKPTPKILAPRDELNQILKNYANTKSFRAKVKTTLANGEIAGVMEFSKPNRFHGTILNSPTLSTELIIVDNDLYMKTTGGTWKNLSTSKGSKVLGETMRNALSGDDGLQKLVLDDSFVIEKTDDAARACTLFTVHVTDKDGEHIVGICANNGLPKFADTTKRDSMISVEYYDYNAVFTIARPL